MLKNKIMAIKTPKTLKIDGIENFRSGGLDNQ